ncbi:hypothetical protein [Haloarchaeobius sp. TZWSO28]|uniref:hypothetical protein n=1 Tax=Haloarchaeobius sp. TZWSO28 TaxID=3446119 RepID=UPI003EC079CD
MRHTLLAQRTTQRPGAPAMYTTIVSAEETLQWADVPRKKEEYMSGYQRSLSDRYQDIADYLSQDENNIIPGSAVIQVDEAAVEVTEDIMLNLAEHGVNVDDLNGELVLLTITVDDKKFEDLLEERFAEYYQRLDADEQAFVDGTLENEPQEGENGALPASHLAELTRELKVAIDDIDSLPEERQAAIKDYIMGVSRPGRIIDGQHRLFGGKEAAGMDVTFPAVIIPGLEKPEEVFQFYVLNSTASPLSRDQLHAVISTSLTNKETELLFHRFKQAGVHAREAKLSYRVHRHPDSPFQSLVDFGLPNSQGVIKESIVFNLVRSFVKMDSSYQRLYKEVDEWDDDNDPDFDYRLKTFLVFWNAITAVYEDAWMAAIDPTADRKDRQILQKIALTTLQTFVLDRLKLLNTTFMSGRKEEALMADHDALDEAVRAAIADLPEEFFTRRWTETSLNTHAGREFFREQMDKAANDRVIGQMKLFRQTK